MSSSTSDGNDPVLVVLGDVRGYNVDHILPLPPTDIVEIRNWLQPTAYDLERSEYSTHHLAYLAGTGKRLTTTEPINNGTKGTKMACCGSKVFQDPASLP
ncbi:hypothetical protein EN45_000290 [Penicillium chrysogenum]|uniref:Uncharacterized protein n=1 Tax=Penicillium chrysogenum TaxID=5076 RepID=A0A167V234_PENCH|nr:hypothetical protein EN45_000290 [Penicillium chrysogenum]